MQSDVAQSAGVYELWAWFEKNKKLVTIVAVGAALLALVIWFVVWQRGEKEVAAGMQLSGISMQYGGLGPHPGAAEAYLKFAASYSGYAAAGHAILLAAGSLFEEGKYDEARLQFQRFIRDYRSSPFVSEAFLGVAACLGAQGKTADAVTAYKDVIDHHASDTVVPQAKLALGRLYLAQNKPDQAHSSYEEVSRTAPYSAIGQEAGMRAAELEKQYTNLVSKPVTMSPGSTLLRK
jgi:TolA-binding protein